MSKSPLCSDNRNERKSMLSEQLKLPTQNDIELVQKFAPTFIFHPRETSYPLSIESLCRSSILKNRISGDTISDIFTPDELCSKYNDENNYLDISSNIFAGGFDQSVPLYCVIDDQHENYIDLQYFSLYSENPGYVNCVCLGLACCICGFHQGDGEHITVRLDRDKTPTNVLFSAHGSFEHTWKEWGDVDKIGNSVVSYIALGSHANYSQAKRYNRIGCFASDLANGSGFMWQPHNISIITDYTAWNNFRGGLSSNFTNAPKKNSWYKNELPLTHKNPTAFRRFFLCCFEK